MQEKLDLKYPIVVEGRYDKAKVSMVISSPIIALDGFSVFNNSEKKELLKRLALEKGLIILTDSDRAGNFIRGKLKGFLSGKVYNVYAPEIVGKERRKKKASSDGLLGVEGMELSVLRELLLPFSGGDLPKSAFISNADFYEQGFSGGKNSSGRRKKLARLLSLPESLSSKALLEAINLLITEEEYANAVTRINNEQE